MHGGGDIRPARSRRQAGAGGYQAVRGASCRRRRRYRRRRSYRRRRYRRCRSYYRRRRGRSTYDQTTTTTS